MLSSNEEKEKVNEWMDGMDKTIKGETRMRNGRGDWEISNEKWDNTANDGYERKKEKDNWLR